MDKNFPGEDSRSLIDHNQYGPRENYTKTHYNQMPRVEDKFCKQQKKNSLLRKRDNHKTIGEFPSRDLAE